MSPPCWPGSTCRHDGRPPRPPVGSAWSPPEMGNPTARIREPLPIRRPGRVHSVTSTDPARVATGGTYAMDLATVKQRQQSAWAAGDYAAVGARFPITAELLCEAVDLRAGE